MPGKSHDREKNKAYKRFLILTEEETCEKDKTNRILYIGRRAAVLKMLRAHFDLVMHVKDPNEVYAVSNEKGSFQPHAIIIDSIEHLYAIKASLDKRGRQEMLLSTPLILIENSDAPSLPAKTATELKVDEVIFADKLSSRQMADKVAFWIKLKSALHSFNQEKKIILPDFYSQGPAWSVSRGLDILIAGIGLVLALPLMALLAVMIKIDSPGPVFYVAPRAGRGYRIFPFYKFRTMMVGAEEKQQALMDQNEYVQAGTDKAVFFKMQRDPRATKLGQWLRKTSLDELPQLFNVLRGDISLVGNRPLPLQEACALTTDHWSGRFMPPAGIVSLWHIQKSDRNKPTVSERMHYDLLYARKQNLLLDLWILIKTPWWVLGMKNK